MTQSLRDSVRKSVLYRNVVRPLRMAWQDSAVAQVMRRGRAMAMMQDWHRRGHPSPPPHEVKVRRVVALAELYGIRTLVETGTYMGDMVRAALPHFDKIYTIELASEYAANARALFRGHPHVSVVEGDSGIRLAEVIRELKGPAIFWLDAHYSGGVTARAEIDTPISNELEMVLARNEPGDVVLIDDARDFNGTAGYPRIEQLLEGIRTQHKVPVFVSNDAICILPVTGA